MDLYSKLKICSPIFLLLISSSLLFYTSYDHFIVNHDSETMNSHDEIVFKKLIFTSVDDFENRCYINSSKDIRFGIKDRDIFWSISHVLYENLSRVVIDIEFFIEATYNWISVIKSLNETIILTDEKNKEVYKFENSTTFIFGVTHNKIKDFESHSFKNITITFKTSPTLFDIKNWHSFNFLFNDYNTDNMSSKENLMENKLIFSSFPRIYPCDFTMIEENNIELLLNRNLTHIMGNMKLGKELAQLMNNLHTLNQYNTFFLVGLEFRNISHQHSLTLTSININFNKTLMYSNLSLIHLWDSRDAVYPPKNRQEYLLETNLFKINSSLNFIIEKNFVVSLWDLLTDEELEMNILIWFNVEMTLVLLHLNQIF